MQHYVRKCFMNPEKEEAWINEMAGKGLGLVGCSFMKYEFEDIIPGEYTYRIYTMEGKPKGKASKEQIRSLEQMNITCVAEYRQCAYLRKVAINGPIEIHTARAKRLVYLRRVHHIWGTLVLVSLAIGAVLLFMVMSGLLDGEGSSSQNIGVLVMLGVFILAAVFLSIDYYIGQGIRTLEEDDE